MRGGVVMDHQLHLQLDMGFLLQYKHFNEQNGTFYTLMSFLCMRNVMCTRLHDWFIWSSSQALYYLSFSHFSFKCSSWDFIAQYIESWWLAFSFVHAEYAENTEEYTENGRWPPKERWPLDDKMDGMDLFGVAYQEYTGMEHRGLLDHTYGWTRLVYGGYWKMDDQDKWGLSDHNRWDLMVDRW